MVLGLKTKNPPASDAAVGDYNPVLESVLKSSLFTYTRHKCPRRHHVEMTTTGSGQCRKANHKIKLYLYSEGIANSLCES